MSCHPSSNRLQQIKHSQAISKHFTATRVGKKGLSTSNNTKYVLSDISLFQKLRYNNTAQYRADCTKMTILVMYTCSYSYWPVLVSSASFRGLLQEEMLFNTSTCIYVHVAQLYPSTTSLQCSFTHPSLSTVVHTWAMLAILASLTVVVILNGGNTYN